MEQAQPSKKEIQAADLSRLTRALDMYVLKGKLNPEELLAKVTSLEYLVYPEGATIVEEGSEGKDLFIVSKGSASVVRGGKQLARLGPGDMFGEVAFLSGQSEKRNATVKAGEVCEVFRCEATGFAEVLAKHPQLFESMRGIAKSRAKKQEG